MIWWLPKDQLVWLLIIFSISLVSASYGDRLPEFQECVEVCKPKRCRPEDNSIRKYLILAFSILTKSALLHRLLLWNCDSECDYSCQQFITDQRIAKGEAIVQFHGKWPFYRFFGMQEPFSVFFSLLNYLAHRNGLLKIRKHIPATYSLRKYYILFAYSGMTSWVFSMIFHVRDFPITEQLDYFAAGGSVLYGLYYTPIRIFRMDLKFKKKKSILRGWTILCMSMYMAHVLYLKLYKWDYGYNIKANVVIGMTQNLLWSWFSIRRYQKSGQFWVIWPGIVVMWILMAMSLELMDFPPLWGCLDAHSLWHLGTVAPTVIWYKRPG